MNLKNAPISGAAPGGRKYYRIAIALSITAAISAAIFLLTYFATAFASASAIPSLHLQQSGNATVQHSIQAPAQQTSQPPNTTKTFAHPTVVGRTDQ